jgi:hypothetical protein
MLKTTSPDAIPGLHDHRHDVSMLPNAPGERMPVGVNPQYRKQSASWGEKANPKQSSIFSWGFNGVCRA